MNKKMKEMMDKEAKAKPKGMAKGGMTSGCAKGATKKMGKAPAKKGKK